MTTLKQKEDLEAYENFFLHPFFDHAIKNLSTDRKLDFLRLFITRNVLSGDISSQAIKRLEAFCESELSISLNDSQIQTLVTLVESVVMLRLEDQIASLRAQLHQKYSSSKPSYFEMCTWAHLAHTDIRLEVSAAMCEIILRICREKKLDGTLILKKCEQCLVKDQIFSRWLSISGSSLLADARAETVLHEIISLSSLFAEKNDRDKDIIIFNLVMEALVSSRLEVSGSDLGTFFQHLHTRSMNKKENRTLLNLALRFVHIYESMGKRSLTALSPDLACGSSEPRIKADLSHIKAAIRSLDYAALTSFG